jgi:hypothetical protein
MDSLVWEEKLDRIKAFSGRKASGFIHVECFNTRIGNSVFIKYGCAVDVGVSLPAVTRLPQGLVSLNLTAFTKIVGA